MKRFSITLFALATILFTSCNDDYLDNNNPNLSEQTKSIDKLNLSQTEKLRLDFGRAFALAIKENPELRKFIKEEAQKKFNKDYDVMYHLVKNKPLSGQYYRSSNNTTSTYNTLRSLLLNYFENESELVQIENQLPLLTVFVPELPESSFSAETWDVDDPEQIPVVAIRLDNTNEVPMIDIVNNHEYVLEMDLIPGYPVVVIKNNERLVVNNNNHNFIKSSTVLNTGDGLSYRFIDDNFNSNITSLSPAIIDNDGGIYGGSFGGGTSSSQCTIPFPHIPGRQNTVSPFLQNAFNIFEGVVTQAWQRDNIYYQLTPTVTTNTYVGGKYVEAISYFRFQGNPADVFNFMSNQFNGSNPDPQLINQNWESNRRVPWTDGRFEIGISVTDNAKNRPNVNATLAFDAKASDLFTYTHTSITRWRGVWPVRWRRTYYKPVINGFKGMDFTSIALDATKLHIHSWDLTEYSNIWNFEIKELDFTTEFTTQTSNVKKYNTNVNIDTSIPLGEKIKVGLKFGASTEETNTSTRTLKWVEGSDFLGMFDVPFGDRIVIKNPCNNQLYPRLYTSSRCAIEIRPIQVEY
jgi:hypothetical protein